MIKFTNQTIAVKIGITPSMVFLPYTFCLGVENFIMSGEGTESLLIELERIMQSFLTTLPKVVECEVENTRFHDVLRCLNKVHSKGNLLLRRFETADFKGDERYKTDLEFILRSCEKIISDIEKIELFNNQ